MKVNTSAAKTAADKAKLLKAKAVLEKSKAVKRAGKTVRSVARNVGMTERYVAKQQRKSDEALYALVNPTDEQTGQQVLEDAAERSVTQAAHDVGKYMESKVAGTMSQLFGGNG